MPLVIADETADSAVWAGLVTEVTHWSGTPQRDEVRRTVRAAGDDGIAVHGSLQTLHRVIEGLHRSGRASEVPVAFVAGANSDEETAMFCRLLDLDTGPDAVSHALGDPPVRLALARDDIGGVLLHSGELTRTPTLKPFGAQAFHDDAMIANGKIGALRVVPDYGNSGLGVRASVVPPGRGSTKRTLGRAVQIACDEVHVEIDGIDLDKTLTKRTWYVDDRAHWLLRGATIPLPYEPQIPGPDRNPFRLRRRF
ncbi:hypothetical protein CLV47_105192 [Antricoccus suffuscus]|uniref:DAGKc domain-containing protein n=1 Tax=Antricoccus suffuscus TaxID=1629062 RepID=A0A2T1A1T5_9ACTN|nr:hypothetical protein [Antricoccus suffuscus]PRZ42570.1 hypothetical protein CLV47_105192 [Antricoccus suffuscus]